MTAATPARPETTAWPQRANKTHEIPAIAASIRKIPGDDSQPPSEAEKRRPQFWHFIFGTLKGSGILVGS